MSTSSTPTDPTSTSNAPQLAAQPRHEVDLGFWLKWMLVTTLGWLIGVLILGVEPIRTTVEVVTYITIASAFAGMFGAIVAASFGLMQGTMLKRYGFSAWAWIVPVALVA
jgi:hypothetical protein